MSNSYEEDLAGRLRRRHNGMDQQQQLQVTNGLNESRKRSRQNTADESEDGEYKESSLTRTRKVSAREIELSMRYNITSIGTGSYSDADVASNDPDVQIALIARRSYLLELGLGRVRHELLVKRLPFILNSQLEAIIELRYVDLDLCHPDAYLVDDPRTRKPIQDAVEWTICWEFVAGIYRRLYPTLGPSLESYRQRILRKATQNNALWSAVYDYDRLRRRYWANNIEIPLNQDIPAFSAADDNKTSVDSTPAQTPTQKPASLRLGEPLNNNNSMDDTLSTDDNYTNYSPTHSNTTPFRNNNNTTGIEICRKYQNGDCPYTRCRRRHVCSKCENPGHGAVECRSSTKFHQTNLSRQRLGVRSNAQRPEMAAQGYQYLLKAEPS
ncbi:hypothetical protein DFS34DRAFT_647589 [Phlyctochytrium arcticum]|nr:hypothetical protein DFS34DRAFT_647589 [Phlyctochytrium arcticum]